MHEDWFNIHIVRYDHPCVIAVALYDHHKDPDENVNIAGNSENAEDGGTDPEGHKAGRLEVENEMVCHNTYNVIDCCFV